MDRLARRGLVALRSAALAGGGAAAEGAVGALDLWAIVAFVAGGAFVAALFDKDRANTPARTGHKTARDTPPGPG